LNMPFVRLRINSESAFAMGKGTLKADSSPVFAKTGVMLLVLKQGYDGFRMTGGEAANPVEVPGVGNALRAALLQNPMAFTLPLPLLLWSFHDRPFHELPSRQGEVRA